MTVPRLFHESLYRFDEAQPSYWEATAGARDLDARPLETEETADVAIIGGGFTGLSAALHLARDYGVDVRVLEAGHIGWGASGRNGGFCSVGGTKLSFEKQVARFGTEETRRYYQSQIEAINLVRDLGRDEGIDFQAKGNAEATVAHGPRHYDALCRQAEMQKSLLGLDVSTMSREAFAQSGYVSPEQHGALILRPTFGLHPLRYVLGLARAAARRGVKLHPASEVLSWTTESGHHRLVTRGGGIKARRVIVACNGFMPEHLHRTLMARTLPAQSNIIVTRPLTADELAAQNWRLDDPAIDARNLFFYFRLLPDGRLLIGGRGDCRGDPASSERTVDFITRRVGEIWPHWKDIEIDYRWRGLICMTEELRPAIGRFPEDPTVYFGFGYHGNGVNTATWTGRELAHWLAGSNSGESTLPGHLPALVRGLPKRFPLPGLRLKFLRAGVAYRAFKDRISEGR